MKTMKIWRIMFAMLAALFLTSYHQSKQGVKAKLQSDSIEVAKTDTLRLVITGEESAASDSTEPVRLKLPLDSIVIEMVNNADITCATGEWYTIEHRVNGKWETLHIKPRKDGLIYGFDDIGHELMAHASRHFTIHIQPDMYDFEHNKVYRIGKEYHVSGEKRSNIVYCNFIAD